MFDLPPENHVDEDAHGAGSAQPVLLAWFRKSNQFKGLTPNAGKPIHEAVFLEHWGDVLRLTAGIKTTPVRSTAMLRKLDAYRQQNRLYFALGEILRIERTLLILRWIEHPELRMACQAGQGKSEARHTLARAVFAHSQGCYP